MRAEPNRSASSSVWASTTVFLPAATRSRNARPVWSGYARQSSGTYASADFASCGAVRSEWPPIHTSPSSASSVPARIASNVDLPLPVSSQRYASGAGCVVESVEDDALVVALAEIVEAEHGSVVKREFARCARPTSRSAAGPATRMVGTRSVAADSVMRQATRPGRRRCAESRGTRVMQLEYAG